MGGEDIHKDLHIAAVVDQNNKVLETQYFSATRQGYHQILTWMASFGALKRIGVELTGTYGSGLLRYCQNAMLEILDVTVSDRMFQQRLGFFNLSAQFLYLRPQVTDPISSYMTKSLL